MSRGFSLGGYVQRIKTNAEVYKGDVDPNDWVVWSLDESGDGGIFTSIFSGPDAEQRAIEYARLKYAEFQRRDLDLQ